MKKAIITSGAQQFLVAEGDQIMVDRLPLEDTDQIKFTPLLIIDGETVKVGQPKVDGATVVAQVVKALERSPKIVAIRFRAKKRVHKRRGQRSQQTRLQISQIKLSAAKPKPAALKPVESSQGQDSDD